jgi:hypothetical protein
MFLDWDDQIPPFEAGDRDYALKQLQIWKAEGPAKRNKRTARYLLDHVGVSPRWSYTLPQMAPILLDLALEWGDFAMWQEVANKSMSNGGTSNIDSDVLIRACNVFSFDRTKAMFVYSVPSLAFPSV